MNKGLGLVHPKDFVMFLNAGDELYEATTLEKIVKSKQLEKADVIYGNVKINSKRLKTIPVKTVIKKFELNYSGKHDGSKIAKFIHDAFTNSHEQ